MFVKSINSQPFSFLFLTSFHLYQPPLTNKLGSIYPLHRSSRGTLAYVSTRACSMKWDGARWTQEASLMNRSLGSYSLLCPVRHPWGTLSAHITPRRAFSSPHAATAATSAAPLSSFFPHRQDLLNVGVTRGTCFLGVCGSAKAKCTWHPQQGRSAEQRVQRKQQRVKSTSRRKCDSSGILQTP